MFSFYLHGRKLILVQLTFRRERYQFSFMLSKAIELVFSEVKMKMDEVMRLLRSVAFAAVKGNISNQ